MTEINITIEQLEALANQIEADDAAERTRLQRLIRAYARVIHGREPGQFKRRATERGDEDGHWDNSYPPKIVFKARTGPRLLLIEEWDYSDIAISSGFYYNWRRVTIDPGLYVDRAGDIYGADETGTGKVGSYAAYPGDCDVECTIRWYRQSADDLTTDSLRTVETALRAIAFPLAAAEMAAKTAAWKG